MEDKNTQISKHLSFLLFCVFVMLAASMHKIALCGGLWKKKYHILDLKKCYHLPSKDLKVFILGNNANMAFGCVIVVCVADTFPMISLKEGTNFLVGHIE